MGIYRAFLVVFCLIVVFGEPAYCSHKAESAISEEWQSYCNFRGIFEDESRWIEEFQMLEEPGDHQNYRHVSDLLGIVMVMPDDLVDRCPKLKKYLSELIKYCADNPNVTDDTKEIIAFIVQHKLVDHSAFEWLTNWLGWK